MTMDSDHLNSEIRTMFGEGKAYLEIGKALGLTRNAVAGRCFRLGLVRKKKAQPVKNSVERERKEKERDKRDLGILAALDAGESQQNVARKFNVSQSVVWHLAKAAREAAA